MERKDHFASSVTERNRMMGKDFFEKSHEIFVDLLNLANEELISKRLKIEPSVIIRKVISPAKDLYFKNLSELLGSSLEKKSRPP